MFEDANKKFEQDQISGNQPRSADLSNSIASGGGAESKQVEDILAEVEGQEKIPPKPVQFQPKNESDLYLSEQEEAVARKIKTKKLIFLLSIIIVLLILVAGGIYGFLYFLNSRSDSKGNGAIGDENLIKDDPDSAGGEEEINDEDVEGEDSDPDSEKNDDLGNGDSGVSDFEEETSTKDTDQDGLTDEEERNLGTNLNDIDSDGDGLFDFEEVKTYKTNPIRKDSDGDGYPDGEEVENGYDPNGPGKLIKEPQENESGDIINNIQLPKLNPEEF